MRWNSAVLHGFDLGKHEFSVQQATLVTLCLLRMRCTSVELATPQDRQSGVGVFYDEEGCGPEAESTSVVGCAFQG